MAVYKNLKTLFLKTPWAIVVTLSEAKLDRSMKHKLERNRLTNSKMRRLKKLINSKIVLGILKVDSFVLIKIILKEQEDFILAKLSSLLQDCYANL